MKNIVTGGAGFIGSNLVDRLINNGDEVIVIDDESADSHEEFYHNSNAKYIRFDIGKQYEQMKSMFKGIDCVFHLAAEARIQPSIECPTLAVRTNVAGTCNVLQAARDHNVRRVVYSSTSAAYGLKNEPPLVEFMDKDCLNPYSVSKCAGEDLCKMYSKLFGLETIIFRYFNVYGQRQPTKGIYAPVIGLFQKQVAEGKPMTVVGDGLQTRDYTNVLDVVQANILASQCDNPEAIGEIFNIGTGKSYSVMDLVNLIGGEDANFEHITKRPGESRHTTANCDKAKNILNWQSKIKLEDWLSEKPS
jgi:UDP-glucose 4-epimerase